MIFNIKITNKLNEYEISKKWHLTMFRILILYIFLNFRYKIILPVEREWGTLKDGRWTGVTGMVNRNVSF